MMTMKEKKKTNKEEKEEQEDKENKSLNFIMENVSFCNHDLRLLPLTPPTIKYHQRELAVKLLHKLNCSVTYLSGN